MRNHINAKTITGIILLVISLALMITVIVGIATNITHTGPHAGKITGYKPPTESHGILMVAGGIGALIAFLAGAIFVSLGVRE